MDEKILMLKKRETVKSVHREKTSGSILILFGTERSTRIKKKKVGTVHDTKKKLRNSKNYSQCNDEQAIEM